MISTFSPIFISNPELCCCFGCTRNRAKPPICFFSPFWGFEISDAEKEEDPSLFLNFFLLRTSESMDLQKHFHGRFSLFSLVLLLIFPSYVLGGDIVHHDDLSPKKPGCENDFILVIYPMPVSCFGFIILLGFLEIC